MVTVLHRRKHGYDVKVYPKEYPPAHVHVQKSGNEVQINLETWAVIANYGFNEREIGRILKLLAEHEEPLKEVWQRFHGTV